MSSPPDVRPLHRPVVSVAHEVFDLTDVVLAGIAWAGWAAFERDLADVLSGEAVGDPPSREELARAAAAWRHARALGAAEDLRAWLAGRRVTTQEWTAHLRRSVLRRRHGAELARVPGQHPPSSEALAAALRPEAICSGFLRTCADQLVRRAGAAAALPEPPDPPEPPPPPVISAAAQALLGTVESAAVASRWSDLSRLDASYRAFAAATATQEAVDGLLRERALDWMQLHYYCATFPHADAAAEAALLVRDDGWSLSQAAEVAGVDLLAVQATAESAPPALVAALAGAHPGELAGPVTTADGCTLAVLEGKRAPGRDDPALVTRAQGEILDRALSRVLAGRVRWHGCL